MAKLKKATKLAGPIDEILSALNPVVRRMCTAGCFAAGTLIATSSGLIAIERIKPGMDVWAWDAQAGRARLCKVEDTFSNPPLPVWRMDYDLDGDRISDGHLVATKDHPIWAENAGQYMPLSELNEGDRLRQLENDRFAEVISIQREAEDQITFNMRIADLHNYYAGVDELLAHNSFCADYERWPRKLTDIVEKYRSVWGPRREAPGYVHWGNDWEKVLRKPVIKGKHLSHSHKLVMYIDELDHFNSKGGKSIDCPDIPGLDVLENDMVRLIRKTENAADPSKGWVRPNPWEKGLKDENGKGFETFDVDVDGVKSEIYHPEGLGTISHERLVIKMIDKIKQCRPLKADGLPGKNAARLYVDVTDYTGNLESLTAEVLGRSQSSVKIIYKVGETLIKTN